MSCRHIPSISCIFTLGFTSIAMPANHFKCRQGRVFGGCIHLQKGRHGCRHHNHGYLTNNTGAMTCFCFAPVKGENNQLQFRAELAALAQLCRLLIKDYWLVFSHTEQHRGLENRRTPGEWQEDIRCEKELLKGVSLARTRPEPKREGQAGGEWVQNDPGLPEGCWPIRMSKT